MIDNLHSLLNRQIKKYLNQAEDLRAQHENFFKAVNDTYHSFDEERKLIERSMELSSQELLQRNSELKQAQQKLIDIINFLPDPTFVIDLAGRVIAWNRSIEQMTGVRAADVIGKGNYEYALSFYHERRPVLIDYVLNGEYDISFQYPNLQKAGNVLVTEIALKNVNGKDLYVWAKAIPMCDEKGVKIGAIESIRDITSQKSAEMELLKTYEELKLAKDRLVQSEKMASIGQLAAGVAHEINNPAAFVASNLEVLSTYVDSYLKIVEFMDMLKEAINKKSWEETAALIEAIREYENKINFKFIVQDVNQLVQQSREGISRIEKIISDLKTFAHEDAGWKAESIKIEDVLEMTLNIAHNELKYRINVQKEYGETPPIRCNAQKMGQVFLNFVMNAVQAIPERGTIGIKTYRHGNYVGINISDTGCGIPEGNLKKIFDPFFTTKPAGKGTGLGLSISYDIVKRHNGEILVESTVGKGSTFTVLLPC